MGQVEYAVGELAEVGPGGADGVHVDVAQQHAGMLVELAEAVSQASLATLAPTYGRPACRPVQLQPKATWFSIARPLPSVFHGWKRFGASPNCTSIPRDVGASR